MGNKGKKPKPKPNPKPELNPDEQQPPQVPFYKSPTGLTIISTVVAAAILAVLEFVFSVGPTAAYNWWKDKQAAAEKEEQTKDKIIAEVVNRRNEAKIAFGAGKPIKAWQILNGEDSITKNFHTSNLAVLLSDLNDRSYDWKGVQYSDLKKLAEDTTSDDLTESFEILDKAFPK